jgi:ATP-binding cassette, subfamily B, bacterial
MLRLRSYFSVNQPSSPDAAATSTEILLYSIPTSISCAAYAADFSTEDALFSLPCDLSLSGMPRNGWLVMTKTHIATFVDDAEGAIIATGPFALNDAGKARMQQTVGSAFLQLRMDGVYVDVARITNGLRETYGRAVGQVNRIIQNEAFQPEALTQKSETVCSDCSLPLPAAKAPCPRCAKKGGILTRTLQLMQPYFGSILMLLGGLALGVGLNLLPPILTRKLVDEVITPHANLHWLPWILAGLVGASICSTVLNIIIGRTSSYVGTKVTKDLRERVQHKLLGLSVDYYNKNSAGSLMSRVMGDVEFFQGFVSQVAQGFLLNILMVLGIGTTLFIMNPHMAMWVLVPIPFVFLGTAIYWRVIYPRYYRIWDSQSKMSQSLHGLLQGIRLVKAFGQEEREQTRFAKNAAYVQTSKRSLEMSAATFNPIMGFVFSVGGLLVWNVGGHDVLENKISLGTLMAYFHLLGMFYSPIQSLSMFSSWATGFVAAGQRVFEVLDSTNQLETAAEPQKIEHVQGRIQLRDVTFGYDPYAPVLKNVNLTIEPGQFVGVVGKSGSGKSTLVNLICRFYDPQQGEVLLDGVNVKELREQDLRHDVALVLQEPFLFRSSIADNIAYGRPDASPQQIVTAAKAANAHEFICKKTHAYDTKLGENGAGLSGGEKQRLSIARALLTDPRILILDEATSSVDTESEQRIQEALATVCKGRTTIAIAHRLSTLKNADVIYVVDEGKIAEHGTHDALLQRQGIYAGLVHTQTALTRMEAAA